MSGCVTLILVGILLSMIRTVTVALLLQWYAMPLGFPRAGFWQVWGLMQIWAMLSYRYTGPEKKLSPEEVKDRFQNSALESAFFHLITLGVGWLVHRYVLGGG